MGINSPATKLIALCYSLLVTRPLYVAGRLWRVAARRPRRTGPFDPSQVRSIAIVKLDVLGDFVLLTSNLRPLRAAFPEAHIALFMNAWVAPLAAGCPYVDEIVPVPVSGQKWRQFLFAPFSMVQLARKKLQGRFDLVINARHDRDTAGAGILAHFSLAPVVMGFPSSVEEGKALYNRGSDGFYTHLLPVSSAPCHEIEHNRRILRYLKVPCDNIRPDLWLSTHEEEDARKLLTDAGWSHGDVLICLGIHAGVPHKMWPIESYIELIERIAAVAPYKFLVVGSNQDREYGELLRPALGASLLNIAGKATLRVSAAAIAQSSLYVGSDSGPMHIAAVFGKPVIEMCCHPLSGDPKHHQAPLRWAAVTDTFVLLSPPHALPPCEASCEEPEPHCIRQVGVGEVFDAVMAVLSRSAMNRQ